MKTVKAYQDDLIEIYCSCPGCEDKLIVTAFKKKFFNDDPFAFHIKYENQLNFWQRIRRAFDFIKGYKAEEISYDCILMNTDQAEELAKCLLQRVEEYREFLKSKEKK